MNRLRGFTLIELMIVIVIVAILATIAYPSFIGSVRKSRRAEAFDFITKIQQAQERWRANNSSYATLAELKFSKTTTNGYYELAVDVPADEKAAGSEYTITANAIGSQAADKKCPTLSIKVAGGNLTYGPSGAEACWSK
jgi:type IV pilus assembly protein PilE